MLLLATAPSWQENIQTDRICLSEQKWESKQNSVYPDIELMHLS